MRPNYKITKLEHNSVPLFISVLNLKALNLIALFNYSTLQKKKNYSIGQWRIKYKTI